MSRVYSVYKGELNNQLVYIGTTVQVPSERFRWHKYNGKDKINWYRCLISIVLQP